MFASAATPGRIQPLRQERVLLWCVLASIALHALVLLGVSGEAAPVPSAKKLLVLTARLAPVAAAPREPLPPLQPVPPAPRPVLDKPAATPAPAAQKTAPAEAVKTAPPESASAAPG